jgi:hypothetical protein
VLKVIARRKLAEHYGSLSFRDTSLWMGTDEPPQDLRTVIVLIGDPECGPLLAFNARPAGSESGPLEVPHGHDSASWRMPLRGCFRMGRENFHPGKFRFQAGGKPYGADEYAWGPDGGWGVTMMADRRGLAVRPVKSEYFEDRDSRSRQMALALGFALPAVFSGDASVETTLGSVRGGKAVSDFADSRSWQLLVPGVKAVIGLVGDQDRGPLVAVLEGAAGTVLWPGAATTTEQVIVVYEGSVRVGSIDYLPGDISVWGSGTPGTPAIAGDRGARVVSIVGDRRFLGAEDVSLKKIVAHLVSELSADAQQTLMTS